MIIFDFDGVIADSLEAHLANYKRVFKNYERKLPWESSDDWRNLYDSSWENNFYKHGFSEEELKEAFSDYFDHLDYSAVPIFDGIEDVIRKLSESHKLGVASTTDSEIIERRLEQSGMREQFVGVVGSSAHSNKVEKFKKALTMTGDDASQSIVVGDTASDISAGKANGMRTIAVSYGWYTRERLEAESPDAIVDSPEALLEAIYCL